MAEAESLNFDDDTSIGMEENMMEKKIKTKKKKISKTKKNNLIRKWTKNIRSANEKKIVKLNNIEN